jgi:MerR family transcriptional regulator, light-induced transcriptional regulator
VEPRHLLQHTGGASRAGVSVNDRSRVVALTLSIGAVERDTGLSKDTLRVWERRYGFPSPQRDAVGERAYTLEQVEKLRVVKRLLDVGHRPGRIVPLPLESLQQLGGQPAEPPRPAARTAPDAADLRPYLEFIRSHDVGSLRTGLTSALSRFGVGRFLVEHVAPLNAAVGDAWLRGQMEVFEEHVYTETVQGVLRQAIAGIPEPAKEARPCVLLSTLPGEPHGLGLLMAEAMLALEGCRCVALGVQTPLWDTVLAATAYGADIVALSFTGCMNPNHVVDGLAELRAKLPQGVQVWAGGSAPVLVRRAVPGVHALASLAEVPAELRRWREGPAAAQP